MELCQRNVSAEKSVVTRARQLSRPRILDLPPHCKQLGLEVTLSIDPDERYDVVCYFVALLRFVSFTLLIEGSLYLVIHIRGASGTT